ncbi:MAG: hypothetical protein ACFFDW_03040 [Candidatus Thorarchaeota archaeon]
MGINDVINFNMYITSAQGSWSDSFDLIIMGVPNPSYWAYIDTDEYNGDLNADEDGIIDPGELVYVEIYVGNTGNSILFDAVGYIYSTDIYVTITDNYGAFGTIEGNGGYDYGYFAFRISGACPIKHHIPFNLSLIDDFGNFWNSTFEIVVSGDPEYGLSSIKFFEYDGDEDSYMDAGEIWYAEISIKNIGDALGLDVIVSLNSDSPYIEFSYPSYINSSFGDIPVGFRTTVSEYYDWQFTISDLVAAESELDMYIAISDDNGSPLTKINTTIQINGTSNYQLVDFDLVEDYYYSNENGLIGAGETLNANVTILNNGEAIGHDIIVTLYSNDKYAELYYGNGTEVDFYDLEVAEIYTSNDEYYWEVTISEKAKVGRVIDFTIVVTDASLQQWVFKVSITVEERDFSFFETGIGQAVLWIGGTLLFLGMIFLCNAKPTKTKFDTWREERIKRGAEKIEEKEKIKKEKEKEKEARKQQKERERIALINENETQLLEKFEAILKMSDRVSISFVAKSLGLSQTQLFEKLIQWQDMLPFQIDNDLIVVEDTDDFSISVKEKIADISKHFSCFVCGFPIERNTELCPDCKSKVEKCVVCKLPIAFGDTVGSCKLCGANAHLTHLQEWIKTQGKCPHCLQKLTLKGIIFEGEPETKNKKSSASK